MTYNFDPNKWYDYQLSIIQKRCRNGEITLEKYDLAVSELDHKLAAMWERLDGTYIIEKDPDEKRHRGK